MKGEREKLIMGGSIRAEAREGNHDISSFVDKITEVLQSIAKEPGY